MVRLLLFATKTVILNHKPFPFNVTGTINAKELRKAMCSLGQNPTKSDVTDVIELSSNRNNAIDFK